MNKQKKYDLLSLHDYTNYKDFIIQERDTDKYLHTRRFCQASKRLNIPIKSYITFATTYERKYNQTKHGFIAYKDQNEVYYIFETGTHVYTIHNVNNVNELYEKIDNLYNDNLWIMETEVDVSYMNKTLTDVCKHALSWYVMFKSGSCVYPRNCYGYVDSARLVLFNKNPLSTDGVGWKANSPYKKPYENKIQTRNMRKTPKKKSKRYSLRNRMYTFNMNNKSEHKWNMKKDVLCPTTSKQQPYIPQDYYIIEKIKNISNNKHNLPDGDYMYIILKKDPSEIRMLPLDFVESTSGGHSSYIDSKTYKQQYEKKNCDMLYAGWITIKDGKFIEWTNTSGHYWPRVKDNVKTGLDMAKFKQIIYDDAFRRMSFKSRSKSKSRRKSKRKPRRKSKSKSRRKSKSKSKRKSKSRRKSKPRRKSKSKPKRKSKRKSKSKSAVGCVRQTQKKYVSRKSPSFPANQCCGRNMRGNDGKMYFSKKMGNGICRWIVKK